MCAGRLAGRLERTASAVEAGATLSAAGVRSGLLRRDEAALVTAAEHGGSLERLSAGLAHGYRRRRDLGRRIRARLWLPGFVLVLGLLVLPLPDLYAGRITPAGFAARALGPLLVAFAALVLCVRLARMEMPAAMASLVAGLPGLGALARRHARAQLLESLCVLLEAGVPAQPALAHALESVSNRALRARFARAARALGAGARVAAALRDTGALASGAHYSLVSAGEEAGRLEESLRRVAELEREHLDGALELVGDWLPRVVYVLVLAALAARMTLPAFP